VDQQRAYRRPQKGPLSAGFGKMPAESGRPGHILKGYGMLWCWLFHRRFWHPDHFFCIKCGRRIFRG
jgi:hypothetical protein